MSANSYQYGYSDPTPPNSPKKDNEWVSWAIIVTLFAIGIWPVALILLFLKLSDKGGKKKQTSTHPPLRTESSSTGAQRAREAAARAAAQAKAESARAAAQGRSAAAQGRDTAAQVKTDVSRSVDQVMDDVSRSMEQAMEDAAKAVEDALSGKTSDARRTAEQPGKTTKAESKARAAAQKMTKTPEIKSSTAKWMKVGGSLLLIFGLMGAWNTVEAIFWAQEWVRLYLWDAMRYAAFSVAGCGLLWSGLRMDRQAKRFQKYLTILGTFEAMSIQQFARKLGYSESLVEKDLLKMIDKGLFGPSAYLNMELGYLFCSSEADVKLAQEQAAARDQSRQSSAPQEADAGYSGILRGIRRANDRIADPVLSAKIDRLEQITARIFKAVEEDPDKKSRIDTFLNYYLPTTQKLLDSYAEFESAGIEGENLRQAKERIETTMDSIVAGFEHQLDELYRSAALDVDSDIRVMETLLGRDTASVAKDFGLGQTAKPKVQRSTDLDLGGSAAQRQED